MENLYVAFWVMFSTWIFKHDADKPNPQIHAAIDNDYLFLSEEECEKSKGPVIEEQMKRTAITKYEVQCTRVLLPYSKFKQIKID